MSERTPDDLVDAVGDAAQNYALSDLPGFAGQIRCEFGAQPTIVGGLPTWEVLVEDWHYTAAAKVIVTDLGDRLRVELVEHYTHAIGDLQEAADGYATSLETAVLIAEAKSRRRSEPAVVYVLGSVEPVVIAIDGALFDRRP